jgi:hypothetical protein
MIKSFSKKDWVFNISIKDTFQSLENWDYIIEIEKKNHRSIGQNKLYWKLFIQNLSEWCKSNWKGVNVSPEHLHLYFKKNILPVIEDLRPKTRKKWVMPNGKEIYLTRSLKSTTELTTSEFGQYMQIAYQLSRLPPPQGFGYPFLIPEFE